MTHTPTGRTRHRVHKPWRGPLLLVLQVEERVTGESWTMVGGHCDSRPVDRLVWRDATLEDLTVNAK